MWERRSTGRHGFGDVVFEGYEVDALRAKANELEIPLTGEDVFHNTFLGRYSPQAGMIFEKNGELFVQAKVGSIADIERVLNLYFGFVVTKRV